MSYCSYADVKVGSFVVMEKKYPCQIIQVDISKPGKHGGSKKAVVGIDVITDKKYTEIYKSSSIIKVPVVTKKICTVMNVDDQYVTVLDNNSQYDVRVDSNDFLVDIEEMLINDKNVVVTLLEVGVDTNLFYRIVQCKAE